MERGYKAMLMIQVMNVNWGSDHVCRYLHVLRLHLPAELHPELGSLRVATRP